MKPNSDNYLEPKGVEPTVPQGKIIMRNTQGMTEVN